MLDAIVARMLARLPSDRYQTASALIVDLERSGLSAALADVCRPGTGEERSVDAGVSGVLK